MTAYHCGQKFASTHRDHECGNLGVLMIPLNFLWSHCTAEILNDLEKQEFGEEV